MIEHLSFDVYKLLRRHHKFAKDLIVFVEKEEMRPTILVSAKIQPEAGDDGKMTITCVEVYFDYHRRLPFSFFGKTCLPVNTPTDLNSKP